MDKRYKEFLIDVLVKAYQIILAVLIVTPIATKNVDAMQILVGIIIEVFILTWAGGISKKMEGPLHE
jgi:hypothetical protein